MTDERTADERTADPRTASARDADEAAARVIRNYSIAAAAAAVQPVPLVDLALLTPIQVGMVRAIAMVYHQPLGLRSALELLGTFGSSLVAQQAVMAAVKLAPGVGLPVAVSVAYAITYAVGEAAKLHFQRGPQLSDESLREVFQRTFRKQRGAVKHAVKHDHLVGELRRLTEARRSGQIQEPEYERRKRELIARVA
jgi:uncharacterized protein (DUF697 family)